MEVVRTVGGVMGSIKLVVDLIDTSKKRGGELAAGLDCVKEDLDLIKARLVEDKGLHRQPLMQVKLQELAYRIDDFVHRLWTPERFGGIVLSAIGLDPRVEDVASIDVFKDLVKNLREELDKRSQWLKSGSSKAPDVASPAGSRSYALEKDLVGIAKAKEEIAELLSPRDGSLRWISIDARRGMGKTALAWTLFQDEDVVNQFDYKAWVVASDPSSVDIVKKILQEVDPTSAQFSKDKRYLVFIDDLQRGKQWEDIQDAFLENMMDSRIVVTTSVPSIATQCSSGSFVYTMQGLDKDNSRELFCRKFRGKAGYSEADKYRLGNKGLDVIVDICDGLPIALISSAECLHGKSIKDPQRIDFRKLSQDLGDNLACSESDFDLFKMRNENLTTFAEMRRSIVGPYENLLSNGEKECLLYGSMFPSGYQINSKTLVRLLIAEGLGPGDPHIMKDWESVVSDVHACLMILMNQRMIEAVPIRINCNAAKSCRVHSIMLQFIIKKAVSRNLVSYYRNGKPLYNFAGSVRRLTVQSSPDVGSTAPPEEMNLSVLRSLAIFKRGIVNFEKCKLVRVLNLEGCCGLTRKDLDDICGLPFLKYLSLRKTDIQELPENVKKLRHLETLDTRDTVVIKLPLEIIMLPQFAYLFGKFELANVHDKNTKKLIKSFSKTKSQLHTFGEISVDKEQDLEIVLLVIQHASQLKKVKVCFLLGKHPAPEDGGPLICKLARLEIVKEPKQSAQVTEHVGASTATATSGRSSKKRKEPCMNLDHGSRLAETLKKSSVRLESVSIDFNGVSNTFLDLLKINGTISSMKLWRGQGSLPGTVELGQVSNLTKLHLFSTGHTSEELAKLQYLRCLQYLKLAEDVDKLWDSIFHVQDGGFISLIWLCFESSNLSYPPLLIDKEVKTPLNSILLLCKENDDPQMETPVPISPGLRVEGISYLAKLNEVILHNSASDAVVEAWKEEAKKHKNMPYVEKQQGNVCQSQEGLESRTYE